MPYIRTKGLGARFAVVAGSLALFLAAAAPRLSF
jgi:hypothetical protein